MSMNPEEYARELDRKLAAAIDDAMLEVDSRAPDQDTELRVKSFLLSEALNKLQNMSVCADIHRRNAEFYRQAVHWSLLGNAVIAILAAVAVLAVKAGWL